MSERTPTPGGMKGGIRRPRGAHGTWAYILYLGFVPAQRCPTCTEAKRRPGRWWVGANRVDGCPTCGGTLIDTDEPRQITEGGFATKRDAEMARATALQRLGRGGYRPSERLALAAYLRDVWLPGILTSGLKENTKRGYQRAVDYHLIGPAARPHALGLIELRRLNVDVIRAHYATMAQPHAGTRNGKPITRPGLNTSSLRRLHACLHLALGDAVEAGYLEHNPADRAGKRLGNGDEMAPAQVVWTLEEMWQFIDSTIDDAQHLLWRVMAVTGCRRGEALGLRWCDIDRDAARLTIRRSRVPVGGGEVIESSPKTGRVRTVDLDADTVALLQAARFVRESEPAEHEVFVDEDGEPLRPHVVNRLFEQAISRAIEKHPDLPRLSPKGLRHSHVSQLLDLGVPLRQVSERVGHSTPTTTLNVYDHLLHGQSAAVAAITRGPGQRD